MYNPYNLLIRPQAKKKLQSLPRTDRFRIAEKLEQLGRNPDDSSLDIKKLEGELYFRLRVGNWRVILSYANFWCMAGEESGVIC